LWRFKVLSTKYYLDYSVYFFFTFVNSDRFVVFAGGMPRASYGERHTVTVMQGDDKHVVFDFTSRVVDFVVLTRADEGDTSDARAGDKLLKLFLIIIFCLRIEL
jgi:hypothetical protein